MQLPPSVLRQPHNLLLQKHDRFIREWSRCEHCQDATASIKRRTTGELTWMWCSLASVVTLCLLPFALDSCSDTELYCAECLQLKEAQRADCCDC